MSKQFHFTTSMKCFNKNNFSIIMVNTINDSVLMCHIYTVDVNNRGASVILIGALTHK